MSDKLNYKAFDDGGADQLLRETMLGHRVEPKPGLWKGISRKLLWRELLRFNFTNLSPKRWVAGTAGLFVVATALYFGYNMTPDKATTEPAGTATQGTHSAATQKADLSMGLLASTHNDSKCVIATNPLNQTSFVSNIANAMRPVSKSARLTSAAPQEKRNNPVGAFLAQSGMNSADLDETTSIPYIETDDLTSISEITQLIPYEANLLSLSPGTDTIITLNTAAGIFKFRKSALTSTRFLSANLGVTPEMSFYSDPEDYSKTNFWINGMVTYHFSRFSLATGCGLGYVYDQGKYKVDYISNDSVGYFNSVTSFTVGINNEIIYNTKIINVYDSLQHLADFRTKNRYSYLQVPLLAGYRLIESNAVSLTIQAGPAISFLLGTRKADPVVEYRNARIIRVDENTPVRIQTNLQIWANLYFEMRVNKNASIYLEPSFKYFLKPVVEQENVIYKAPWTIGLGVGLQFNFGQNTSRP